MIHGERVASRQMRKFGIKFAAIHPEAAAVKKAFIAAESLDEWSAVIDHFYAGSDSGVETERAAMTSEGDLAKGPFAR